MFDEPYGLFNKLTKLYNMKVIGFDTVNQGECAEGQLNWNIEAGTLQIGMPGGNVCLQIGQEQLIRIKNDQGAKIFNGSPVYISGASGANALAKLADASATGTSATTIAVVTEDIESNQLGYATTFGLVRDVDTDGIPEGSTIYLSTDEGEYTDSLPQPPDTQVRIGYILREHQDEGVILVNIEKLFTDVVYSPSDLFLKMPDEKTVFLEKQVYRDEYPAFIQEAGAQASPDNVNVVIGGVNRRIRAYDGNNTEERMSGSFEIPHDYKEGGTIEVHVHWRPSDNNSGNVKWFFDWEYSGVNEAPDAQSTLSVTGAVNTNEQHVHKITAIGNLPANGYTLGDKIGFNLRRTPSDSEDTYGSDALFEQVALHIPVDTLGSRQIYVK